MKTYRMWMPALFVLAILLGSSAIAPRYSEANRLKVSPMPAQPVEPAQATELSRNAISAGDYDSFSLNVERRNHTATVLPDGRVIIIGGNNESGAVSEVEMLDPSLKTLKVVARSLVPRTRHTATLLRDGRVLVTGGANQSGLLNSTEIFDPSTDSFSPGARLQRARAGHSATLLENGLVLIAGGRGDGSVELFDPLTERSFLAEGRMKTPRTGHGAIALKDGNVLLAGGYAGDGHNLDSAEVFYIGTSRFSPTARPMLIPRARPSFRVLPDGKVQVIGGDYEGTMEIYNPASGRFEAVAHLMPTADLFSRGEMLSGQTRAGFIDSINYRDAKIKRQYSTGIKSAMEAFKELKVGRSGYAAAEIPNLNRAVVIGGIDDDKNFISSALVLPSSAATVSTDKVEYLPGDAPVITGTGWRPGEIVNIIRQEARLGHKRTTLRAVADKHGNFVCTRLTANDYQVWVTYTLTARGEFSGQIAQTVYFDAPLPGRELESLPKQLKFNIPITIRDGSVETETVMLKWRTNAPVAQSSDGAVTTAAATCTVPNGSAFNYNPDFSSVLDQPCLGISGDPCGTHFGVRFKEACLAYSGSINASVCLDPTGIFCDPPHFRFSVQEDFKGHLVLAVDLNDGFSLPLLNIPIPGLSINVGIPGINTFSAEIGVDVRAKIEATVTTPSSFEVTADLSQGAEVGVDTDASPVFFNTQTTTPGASGDLTVTKLGESSVKVEVGPSVGLTAKIAGVKVLDFGLGVLGFVEPSITDVKNDATCQGGKLDLHAGAEGELIAKVATINGSQSLEFFSVQIPGFPKPFALVDTAPPTFTGVQNITAQTAPGQCSATVDFTLNATDDCSGVDQSSATASPPSGSTFQKGTTTVTVSVKDNAGNLATTSFTVTVVDSEAPSITCPGDVTQGTDANKCSAVVNFTTTATDNCDGNLTPSCTPASGSTFPKGTTTVNCTATDSSGNTSSPCSFAVTVNDNEKPVITSPGNLTQGTDANKCSAVVNFTPTATDNCDGDLTPSCTPASGSTFPKGITTVNCAVSDAAGNQASPYSFTVTVNDTQKPAVTCPANISVPNVVNTCAAPVTFSSSASDNCDGSLTPICTPASGSTFNVGTTTVTCSATDAAGNTATCSFSVTVNDVQPPVVTCPGNVNTPNAAGLCSAIVNFSASANDNCGALIPVCVPASGSAFPVGTTSVTCSAHDAAGNTANCSFSVTVMDVELPTIVCPANITMATANVGGPTAIVNYSPPAAADNCGVANVVCNPPSGSAFRLGTTAVTCTATDTSGNQASCSFTVTVFDVCTQDDSNPSRVLLWNSVAGDYLICFNGTSLSGRGTPSRQGNIFKLTHYATDRRLVAQVDSGTNRGAASLQKPVGQTVCSITDRDTRNNTCACSVH